MRTASLIVFGICLVLFGAWLFFVKAPPPRTVCAHVLEVAVAEARRAGMSPQSEAAVVEQISAGCMQHKLDKIQLRGRIVYARYAKCVVGQATMAGIESC